MRANETPEKIYIMPNLENRTWLIGKGDISSIEYVRADAIIEKTCEWIGNNANKYWGTEFVDSGEMVEDLRNYLKGG